MKKTRFALMTLVGGILLGSNAFAEREAKYDYSKALELRREREMNEIEKYSKIENVSINQATVKYYNELKDEFQMNADVRTQMMRENYKN